jgi:phosphoenolpyruvate-protein phosphotransferase (PTS system enzyme I)
MVSEKTDIPQDTLLIGIAASPGIAIGKTYLLDREYVPAVERRISVDEVDEQIDSFLQAVLLSKQQLKEVRSAVTNLELAEHLYIIDTHLLILDDQMLIEGTFALIRDEFLNAEGALKRTLQKFKIVFDSIKDEYLRERCSDIDSVGERLLRNLKGQAQESVAAVDGQVIVVAHDLSPADTMQMDKGKIIGFVTDLGGRTSHTAILARSMGIPAVIGLQTVSVSVTGGTSVIVDGSQGTLVLNPSAETFREYETKQRAYASRQQDLLGLSHLGGETLDGYRVHLRGNVELAEEIPLALRFGSEGVGLFRSEFLYLGCETPPCEADQVTAYRTLVETMAPHPVTIRSLDLGGDKFVAEINLSEATNPAMGLRAVRFSLKECRLFKTQLRAILQASAFGPVRLMFPMISGVSEIRSCKELLEEARSELTSERIAFDPKMPIGIMIEVPSAALIADLLAREVDFFSVGTNDLIQYCLAVDRGNEHVAYLYDPLHPAILRALQTICQAARNAGIPVGMCGEMASDPLYALVLLGLGFDELSMNPPSIPRVKEILRKVRKDEGEQLLAALLELSTGAECNQYLDNEMSRRFPGLFKTVW